MQIEIITAAYANNRNYNAITEAIRSAGYDYFLQLDTKSGREGVTLKTEAPLSVLNGVEYTASAVTIRT